MMHSPEKYEELPGRVKSEGQEVLVMGKSRRNPAHHRIYYCSECGKSFSVPARFRRHLRIHTGDKPYPCSRCLMRFTSQENLSEHVAHKHTSRKPHLCPHCGKGFVRPGKLDIHMRVHSGEKPHACAQCGKSFKSSEELQRHAVTHTGLRPHQCSECESSFRREAHLLRHMRTHSGERPHQCVCCQRSFSRSDHLRTHRCRPTGNTPTQSKRTIANKNSQKKSFFV